MNTQPAGWSPAKLQAWNDLLEAVLQLEAFTVALQQLGITSGPYVQAKDEVAALVTESLGPAFLRAV